MAHQEIVLTSLQQYRSEVRSLPRLTDSEERELEQRARRGNEQARTQLIESSLRYVASVAWRYACYMQHDDYLDLVSLGNVAVVESIEKALTVEKPSAYLRGAAKHAIQRYCFTHSSLITRQRGQDAVAVWSLDAALRGGSGSLGEVLAAPTREDQPGPGRSSSRWLSSALAGLTRKQRYVIMRHFGLDGKAPESIASISRRLSGNPKVTLARNRFNQAIRRLRRQLAEQ